MRRLSLALTLVVGLLAACAPPIPTETIDLPTLAAIPTITETLTPTITLTPSPTTTSTITPTASNTPTETATVTASPSLTDTPPPTPTITPTAVPPTEEPSALSLIAELAAVATILPPDFVPGQDPNAVNQGGVPAALSCPATAPGGFGVIFEREPGIEENLGCPALAAVRRPDAALQAFERGLMLWVNDEGSGDIYVLLDNGNYFRFSDTWDPVADPESGSEVPPGPNLQEPIRGFGKIWRNDPAIKEALGWAITGESGLQAAVGTFDNGTMLDVPPRGEILVLFETASGVGRWRAYPGSY